MNTRARALAIVYRGQICEHEAGHAAGLVMAGMVPKRIRISPTSGAVSLNWDGWPVTQPERTRGLIRGVLAGPICGGDPLPLWPILPELSADERVLWRLTRAVKADEGDWKALIAETYEMADTEEFRDLERVFRILLDRRDFIEEDHIRAVLRGMNLDHHYNGDALCST